MESKTIREIGNYYLEKVDDFYGAYSGYNYIVVWGAGFCHKQLKGFKDLESAQAYLERVAKAGRDDKRYRELKESQKTLKPEEWTAKCCECGKTMAFSKESFTYRCSCGNRLEV